MFNCRELQNGQLCGFSPQYAVQGRFAEKYKLCWLCIRYKLLEIRMYISRINYLCVVWSFFSQWKETGTSQVQLGLFETAKLG